MFPHSNIHKITLTSDGKTHNQIDHILTDRKWHSSVPDVQSLGGADCDTDHYLVVAKVRERPAVSKQTTYRFHMERLNFKILKRWMAKSSFGLKSQFQLQIGKTLMMKWILIELGKLGREYQTCSQREYKLL
jgi:hypothetical protein